MGRYEVMSATNKDSRIKELKKTARMEIIASVHLRALDQPEAQEMALKLERSSSEKLELAENLKILSRLDALSVYSVEMAKTVRKGETKTYSYWYASWRVDTKVRNVYVGSVNKMSQKEALNKARKLKAKDLGINL